MPLPVWFTVLVGICFFQSLGGVALFDLDEGAFTAASFEMLLRQDYITTYLNGVPRFDKPILIYWLQVISVSLFGINEWGFRLPSAVAASFWMWGIYRFSAQYLNRESAIAAVLFGASSFLVVVIGRAATADALLNLFIALTMFSIYRYTVRPHPATVNWVFLWMGLGVLTKGPVAILIPLVVSFLYFALGRDLKTWLKVAFRPLPWLIFLLVVTPWYVLEYLDQGQAFINGFFLKHNLSRFSSTMEGHGGNPFYYLPILLLIFMPYTTMLGVLLTRLRVAVTDPLDRYMWLWFAFVLLFFSFSSTQLPHYLLYGASPLFVLMAKHRTSLSSRFLAYLPAILFFSVLLFLPEILKASADNSQDLYIKAVAGGIDAALGLAYRVWSGLALLATVLLLLAAKRYLSSWQGLQVLGLVQALFMTNALIPAFGQLQQEPVRNAAIKARSLDATVVMWQIRMPSFTVYRGAVTPSRVPQPGEVVFTRIDKLDQIGRHDLLYQQGGFVLARLRP